MKAPIHIIRDDAKGNPTTNPLCEAQAIIRLTRVVMVSDLHLAPLGELCHSCAFIAGIRD